MPGCRYCGTMHPHVARAAEKVEIVKQMLAPGPGGIPAALQGMVAPYQGMMPNYTPQQIPYHGVGAPPPVIIAGGMVSTAGAAPPQFGGPMGSAGYAAPMYGAPDAARAMRRGIGVMVAVFVAIFVVLALVGVGIAFFVLR
jgi:hypothetical protein